MHMRKALHLFTIDQGGLIGQVSAVANSELADSADLGFMMKKLALAALAALFLPQMASAKVELITNGSFAQNNVADGKKGWVPSGAGIVGWMTSGQSANFYWDPNSGQITGGSNLMYLATPGTADKNDSALTVYGPFPKTSPDGGDFIMADGDYNFANVLSQTVNGLTVGETYVLNFWQAAGQHFNRTGPTTEQWKVSFGSQTQYSDKFSLKQGEVGPWEYQTMSFVASKTSQVLSFLAGGTPTGQPPISFLDGVSMSAYAPPPVAGVPEPSTWAMMIMGFGPIGGIMRRGPRRALA